jgi:hypothetical protein
MKARDVAPRRHAVERERRLDTRIRLDDHDPRIGDDGREQLVETRFELRPAFVRRVEQHELVPAAGRALVP